MYREASWRAGWYSTNREEGVNNGSALANHGCLEFFRMIRNERHLSVKRSRRGGCNGSWIQASLKLWFATRSTRSTRSISNNVRILYPSRSFPSSFIVFWGLFPQRFISTHNVRGWRGYLGGRGFFLVSSSPHFAQSVNATILIGSEPEDMMQCRASSMLLQHSAAPATFLCGTIQLRKSGEKIDSLIYNHEVATQLRLMERGFSSAPHRVPRGPCAATCNSVGLAELFHDTM